jgi:hypothetical protein
MNTDKTDRREQAAGRARGNSAVAAPHLIRDGGDIFGCISLRSKWQIAGLIRGIREIRG